MRNFLTIQTVLIYSAMIYWGFLARKKLLKSVFYNNLEVQNNAVNDVKSFTLRELLNLTDTFFRLMVRFVLMKISIWSLRLMI